MSNQNESAPQPRTDSILTPDITSTEGSSPHSIRRKSVPTSATTFTLLERTPSSQDAPSPNDLAHAPSFDNDTAEAVDEAEANHQHHGFECIDPTKDSTPSRHSHNNGGNGWLPYTLHWAFLAALLGISLVLLAIVIYLQSRSRKDHGLCDNDGQSVLFFGWRFAPTLVATVYSLLCTMLLDDIKRTEPFARLVKPTGGPASSTVFRKPGAWWNALADGFPRGKNDKAWSLPLIFSATSLVLALLVISPLSSTFLVSVDVAFTHEMNFHKLEISRGAPLELGDQVVPRFRTISNILQNVTTSAWITNEFVVLPFWPPTLAAAPLGASPETSPEVWSAETTVYTSELECTPLHLDSHAVTKVGPYWFSTITLATTGGCVYNLALENTSLVQYGGGSWARPELLAISVDDEQVGRISLLADSSSAEVRLNYTQQCIEDELLILSTPWLEEETWSPGLQVAGELCSAHYYSANIPVSLAITESDATITFEQADFRDTRRPIDRTMIGIDHFEDMFLSPNWSYHFATPETGFPRPSTGGPSCLLAAMHKFSMADVISDRNLVDQAAAVKQRYFGEAIISSLSKRADQSSSTVDGTVVSLRTRIVVAQAIAFTLEALLCTETLLLLGLYWSTRPKRRPLGIESDPAEAATLAALISSDAAVQGDFLSLQQLSKKQVKHQLRGTRFWTSHHHLSTTRIAEPEPGNLERNPKICVQSVLRHERPRILRRWTIACLSICLIAILVAIGVLYGFSLSSGLYEKALVYETSVVISGSHLSTFAPYSIVPTLLAVCVGLWWGSMETLFRAMQPFLTMTSRPVTFTQGLNLSYQSSYLLWATAKAVSHEHWLLSLVCTGAFFSQAFTVAMSALWQETYEYRNSSTTLHQSLELRTIPTWMTTSTNDQNGLYDGVYLADASVLSNLYGQLQTNWLYSAIIQMTLNGTEPAWSSAGWSFVPVDISSLGHKNADQAPVSGGVSDTINTVLSPNVLVTLTTPAVRAQLQCSPYETLSNISNWSTLQDLTNGSIWNVTANPRYPLSGYTLGCGGSNHINLKPIYSSSYPCDSNSYTSFLAHESLVQCCENKTSGSPATNGSGEAVVAYWSPNSDSYPGSTSSNNFTVKWIYGRPVAGFMQADISYQSYEDYVPFTVWPQQTTMIWPELPQMAALNCKPILQKAKASVTVDQESGRVQFFSILDDIIDDENAWTDSFVAHLSPSGSYPDGDGDSTNVTTSYGSLFRLALLYASDVSNLADAAPPDGIANENVRDSTFNFRMPGINMDYMSYAMLSQVQQAGQDKRVLLDLDTLSHHANRTFATFFQHYVSSNLSLSLSDKSSPSFAYQPIGASLPPDLGAREDGLPETVSSPSSPASPSTPTARAVVAQVSVRTRILHMSPLAAWLCMAILLWLIATTVLILAVEKRYLARLLLGGGADVETVAEVLGLVAGSRALLGYIEELRRRHESDGGGGGRLRHHRLDGGPLTKLGWFRDRDTGVRRWGIELVGEEWGVEWLDEGVGRERRKEGREGMRNENSTKPNPTVVTTEEEASLPTAREEEPAAEAPSVAQEMQLATIEEPVTNSTPPK